APDVLATAMSLAKTIKKTAVVSGVCDGFIGNRMIAAYSQQAMNLLEEGASPQDIDQALETFGMAMGPFRMSDLAGNDIGWAIRKHKQQTQPDPHYPRIADRLCEMGRYGQKTGRGWYLYESGSRDARIDPTVDELIASYRNEKRFKPRSISAEEITNRCVLALVSEGARILEERIAQRASDIDMVYLSGYGFPLYRGGPMFYADNLGLKHVVEKMEMFFRQTGDPFWRPAQILADLATRGKSFN
ncbi:MAG TPA: 3-hydroxyacyl-CoA dehydrogenase family protein, partial [Oligoflexus sp.]|uniref:3-hydroxyacyl-CoA dehydrogenase family protein n=1 Tax=Oligoflexus sp. TaxID=1971216 RepID=UPI002D3BB7CD